MDIVSVPISYAEALKRDGYSAAVKLPDCEMIGTLRSTKRGLYLLRSSEHDQRRIRLDNSMEIELIGFRASYEGKQI